MNLPGDDDLVSALADPRRRGSAAGALIRRGSEVEPAVRRALASPDPAMRAAAVNVLGRIGGDVLPCLRDPDFAVRETAVRALAERPPAPAVLFGLLRDPQPDVRAAAAAVLGGLDGDEIVSALVRSAADPDATVRAGALRGLGARAPEAAIRALRDPEAEVRALAAHALRGAGVGVSSLIDALSDSNDEVRRQAAGSLTGVREAVPALILALQRGEWAAAEALGETRASEAVPALISALDDPRTAGRAAMALGEIGDPRAIPGLKRLAKQPRERGIRPDERDAPGSAREALARLGVR